MGRAKVIVVGYWSGSPRRLLPVLTAAGFDVEYLDLMDPEVAEELYDEEHPLFASSPHLVTQSLYDDGGSLDPVLASVEERLGDADSRPVAVVLCQEPAVVPRELGRVVLDTLERSGGGLVIGLDGIDQIPRWLSWWHAELGVTATRLAFYQSPPDRTDALPGPAGRIGDDIGDVLRQARYRSVSLADLDVRAAEARREGKDVLAGSRWRLEASLMFERAALVGAGPWQIGRLPDGAELTPGLTDLRPAGHPAYALWADGDILGIEKAVDSDVTAWRFAVDFDAFGVDTVYERVGELDVSSGHLWIGDLDASQEDPLEVTPGRYVVESAGSDAFRVRWIAPPDTAGKA